MTDDEADKIAEKISQRLARQIRDDLYREIGKGFISRLAWVMAVIGSALTGYLGGKHIL